MLFNLLLDLSLEAFWRISLCSVHVTLKLIDISK